MEPPATGYDAIDHIQSSVHDWRVSQLTRLGIPGRWPRSTPTASTGIRSPGWCATAARRGLPSASSADAGREESAR
jgi:hypothetical protein